MNTFIFKTTTTMKEYNDKKYWIDSGVCEEFDCKTEFTDKFFNEEWEWMDVTIRCYLLSEIVETVVEEME